MKKIFTIFLFLSITLGMSANSVTVGFQSMDISSLPIEKEQVKEAATEDIKTTTNASATSVFSSTYIVIFFGLVGIYLLLLRKKESRGMNL